MNINIVRLNANNTTNDFVERLNTKLKNNNIILKENVRVSPLTLFFVESGGTEAIFTEKMKNYPSPYYFVVLNENNAIASMMEISSYLSNKGLEFETFINEDEVIHNITNLVCAYNAKYKLIGKRLGVIGNPSSWLIASHVNYRLVKQRIGLELIDIDLNELYKFIEKPYRIEYPTIHSELSKKNPFDTRLLFESILVYNGLKRLVNKYNLSGLTIRCFDLVKKYKVSACLALSLLNDEGIISGCEGDIPSLITMMIVKCLTGKLSFMANLSAVDYNSDIFTFAHCTIPTKMCSSFGLDHHYESNESLAIKGNMYHCPITVVKLAPSLASLRVVSGEIIDNASSPCFCKTQIKVKLAYDIDSFITAHYGNHSVIVYGRYEKLFNTFFKII